MRNKMILIAAYLAGWALPAQTQTTYRALVAYTQDVRIHNPDIPGLINLAIQETNQAYINSQTNARVVLARSVEVNFTDNISAFVNLDRFMYTGGDNSPMDEIHALRNEYSADIAILLVHNQSDCGLAPVASDQSTAFAVVADNCATGNYSTGHEVAHIFGGRHNWAVDQINSPYPYGHGYISPTNAWRDILSYPCSNPGGCPRIQYFSNPDVIHPGSLEAMGTAAREDVARVHDERIGPVAGFRPLEASRVLQTQPIRAREYGEAVASSYVELAPGFAVENEGQLVIQVAASGLAKQADPGVRGPVPHAADTEGLVYTLSRQGVEMSMLLEAKARLHAEVFDFMGRRIGARDLGGFEAGHRHWTLPLAWFGEESRIVRIKDGNGRTLGQKMIIISKR